MQIQPSISLPLKKIGQTTDTTKETELKKACQGFEAIILQQMLTSMRKSIPKDGLLDSGYSQEMYQSMYDEGLAKEMANGKGIGLADALYQQLSGPIQQENDK